LGGKVDFAGFPAQGAVEGEAVYGAAIEIQQQVWPLGRAGAG